MGECALDLSGSEQGPGQTRLNVEMNFQIPQNVGNFVSN
jgi:hypothetical protein